MTEGLVAAVSKAKTPMALASLMLVVLYFLLSQIVGLDLFTRINADQTSTFFMAILNALFYLAMVSIVLSIVVFALPTVLRQKKSKVRIVSEAIVEPRSTGSEQKPPRQ
jgi:hypothetical protein